MQNFLLALLLLPLLYQLIWGFKAVYHPSKIRLSVVAVRSLIAHIILSYVNIQVVALQLSETNFYCSMPIIPVVVLCIALFFLMLIVIGIQLGVRRWVVRPAKKNF